MRIQSRFTFDKVRFDQENEVHLVLSLNTPKTDWQDKRPAVCIIPVIDMSSSMNGEKLDYAKKSVIKLIEHLKPGDFCGVVTFHDNVTVLSPPVEMTQTKKDQLRAKVGDLYAQGCTNFSGGMLEGLALGNRADLPSELLIRIIMFTDGQANRGVATKREQLLPLLEQSLGKATLSAFGYGADADQELLADLAKKGKGNYAFVKNPDDALSAFAKELGGLLSTYAQNIKLHVSPNNGHRITEVVSDVDVDQSGNDVTISLPDILAEEERHLTLAVKLSKQNQALPRAMNVADVKVTYDLLDEGGKRTSKTETIKAKITFVKEGDEQAKPTEEVDKIVAIAQLVKKQTEAEQHAKRGDWQGAASVMNNLQQELKTRGLIAFADAAGVSANAMSGAAAYASNQGYLRSMKGGGTRGVGVSGMDARAQAFYTSVGSSVSNASQDFMVQNFTAPSDPAPVPPAAPPPAETKKKDEKKEKALAKKRSSSRW